MISDMAGISGAKEVRGIFGGFPRWLRQIVLGMSAYAYQKAVSLVLAYRETLQAIDAARAQGILAVEMEAAALYAFAEARQKAVLCFAHVTNQMGQSGDFEKGEANGATASLALIRAVAEAYLAAQS